MQSKRLPKQLGTRLIFFVLFAIWQNKILPATKKIKASTSGLFFSYSFSYSSFSLEAQRHVSFLVIIQKSLCFCYLKTCLEHTSLIKSSKNQPKKKKKKPDLGSLGQNSLSRFTCSVLQRKNKMVIEPLLYGTAVRNTTPWPYKLSLKNMTESVTSTINRAVMRRKTFPYQLLSTCVLPSVFPVYDPKEL